MSKVTMIKNDAVVSIQVSAGFLAKIQKMMIGIISEKSSEEIEQFKKEVEDLKKESAENVQNKELSEDWMESLYTLTLLVTEIEKTLIKEGHTYEEEITSENTTLPE